ncbi:ABC transporter substrate-binding protein [Nocardia huaxiensis]|uniref:ABC transporter substrate-binding protein n=1 Tax=Nocardia huaxiensis TaxID=2755382 RepID=A0A7D6ZRM3_9NOCA|nr:ABC transporter substrate-binding protein [Nocardia huaxiensis]
MKGKHLRHLPRILAAAVAVTTLAACGTTEAAKGDLTIANCGVEQKFPSPAQRMFVNDGNLISMVLALGAQDQVAAVSSVKRDAETLRRHYGDVVDELNSVSPEYPSRETVLAQRPDVMVAGWNYGYSEAANLTPDSLRAAGVAPYVLTESCRQADGERGITDAWTALRTDLTDLGAITGRGDRAAAVNDDIGHRVTALRLAPQPVRKPTIFLFDSGSDTIFSSGKFGAPQAILDAAGARNALEDVDDTWTAVSWERLAAADPDAIVFVDYPPQTFQQKVDLLRGKPGIANLRAVTEGRFLNLPYALWTSGPLNIDAAEQVRVQLEKWNLVPASGIRPAFDDAVR